MEVTPQFPMYFVASSVGHPMIDDLDGHECFIAYQTQELAELFIRQTGQRLKLLMVPDESALAAIFSFNSAARFVAWNNVQKAQTFVMLPVDKFFG